MAGHTPKMMLHERLRRLSPQTLALREPLLRISVAVGNESNDKGVHAHVDVTFCILSNGVRANIEHGKSRDLTLFKVLHDRNRVSVRKQHAISAFSDRSGISVEVSFLLDR